MHIYLDAGPTAVSAAYSQLSVHCFVVGFSCWLAYSSFSDTVVNAICLWENYWCNFMGKQRLSTLISSTQLEKSESAEGLGESMHTVILQCPHKETDLLTTGPENL